MKSVKSVFAAFVAFGTCVAFAQDESASSAAKDAPKKVETRASFTTLPFCRACEGVAEVQIPGKDWTLVEDGRFYPLGSAFRTKESGRLTIAFGESARVSISGEASFATRAQALGVKTRTIVLGTGELTLTLADNMPEGAFFVTAPGFTVRNPAGESRYVCTKTAFGDRAVVRCVTGSLVLEGHHFEIPQMRAANEVVLQSEHDQLVTVLENTSGDYLVKLDQGVRIVSEVSEAGATEQKAVSEKAEIKLSPKMKINIHRAVPSIGERMSVFIIAFDAAGNPMGPGLSFCEGRAEVNSGTLVSKSETAADALAKKAAEATETTDAAAEDADSETSTKAESEADSDEE